MTTYYVDSAAGGGGSGSSGSPWTYAEAAAAGVAAGSKIYFKGTFDTLGAIMPNDVVLEGYTTTPGDGGLATFTRSTAGYVYDGSAGNLANKCLYKNISFDGSASAENKSFATAPGGVRVTFHNCELIGEALFFNTPPTFQYCYLKDTGSSGFIGYKCFLDGSIRCYEGVLVQCLIQTSSVLWDNNHKGSAFGCTFAGTGSENAVYSAAGSVFTDCIFEDVGTAIHTFFGSDSSTFAWSNSYYNAPAGFTATDAISPSASVLNDKSGGDWGINNTAGAGALLRGLARAFPRKTGTVSYADIGAVQHQDSGGGGGGGGGFKRVGGGGLVG